MNDTNARPTVLLADDEPIIAKVFARLAQREGLHFLVDMSSEHVVELAAAHRPDVIVLDIMQRVDGRDLLAQLKSDPRTSAIKVLMLSAVEDQWMRHTCFELGAADYDLKPVDAGFMSKLARTAREQYAQAQQ